MSTSAVETPNKNETSTEEFADKLQNSIRQDLQDQIDSKLKTIEDFPRQRRIVLIMTGILTLVSGLMVYTAIELDTNTVMSALLSLFSLFYFYRSLFNGDKTTRKLEAEIADLEQQIKQL